jgi:hypothetical protein
LWGVEEHVRSLFGDRVDALAFTPMVQDVHFDTPAALVAYYQTYFGPTIMTYRSIAGDPERTAALDAALLELATRMNLAADGEPARYEFEYVIVVARRAP